MNPARANPRGAARQMLLLALGFATFHLSPSLGAAEARNRTDLTAFRLISERNIFNASRSGGRLNSARETRRPTRVDAFGLVGVMSYSKGTFAFFDGSSSDYHKALQQGAAIAGFQLVEILPSAVKLQNGTNHPPLELHLGMQMRREEEGEWKLGERTESFDNGNSAPGPSSSPSPGGRPDGRSRRGSATAISSSSAGGSDADALQRLLKKREEENK